MKPDVIVAWPRHADYPLWRASILAHRPHVGRVLVAFTNHHADLDYRDFVAGKLAGIAECFDAPEGDGDWRDRAVNAALDRSSADTVWFTEQDLLVADPADFWSAIRTCFLPAGWKQDGYDRWHPSCLLATRAQIAATSRYFGPDPDDHFHRFGLELGRLANLYGLIGITNLRLLLSFRGFLDRDSCDVTHMSGLSSNHRLIDDGCYEDVFQPDALAAYLYACLAGGDAEPGWDDRARAFLAWHEGRD